MTKLTAPHITEVECDVFDAWENARHFADPTAEDNSHDLRLVVNADNAFVLRDGPACYDPDHGVACGAATIDLSDKPTWRAARAVARDLIEQVADALAEYDA